MTTNGIAGKLLLALAVAGSAATMTLAAPTPAAARVFIGFGVAPWWGPYYYAPPPVVYAPPPAYVPPPTYAAPVASSWYYCDDPQGYYPYVRSCNLPWRPVPAQPQ